MPSTSRARVASVCSGAYVLAEAGRKVLRFHLARMLAREEGTRTAHAAIGDALTSVRGPEALEARTI